MEINVFYTGQSLLSNLQVEHSGLEFAVRLFSFLEHEILAGVQGVILVHVRGDVVLVLVAAVRVLHHIYSGLLFINIHMN